MKISVFSYEEGSSKDLKQLAEASIDGITAPPAKLKYSRGDKEIKGEEVKGDIKTQKDAFEYILKQLKQDDGLDAIRSEDDIHFATHRIVHGGTYKESQLVGKETMEKLEELSDLAPLHNAPALTIIKAVHESLPKTKNIAYFDTSFHSTIPPHIYTYPLPPKKAKQNNLRKYGFHGISYAYILRSVAAHLKKDPKDVSIIALHLGSGASACCIKNGASYDTTMGLTPLAGLPGATRSGDIDPSLVFHFTHDAGKPSSLSSKDMHLTTAEEILNKQCGWKALTGTTNFGEISSKAEKGDEDAKLAYDLFVDRIVGFVGGYFAKLKGECDALVFAGGIGEKGVQLRRDVVEHVRCLGFELDAESNEKAGDAEESVFEISSGKGTRRVLVCQTDEQFEMARGVVEDAKRFE